MLRVLIAIIIVAASSWSAVAQSGCDEFRISFSARVAPLTDMRLKGIAEKVAAIAGLNGENMPFLCMGEIPGMGPTAGIIPLYRAIRGKKYALIVPEEFRQFADDEVNGIVAHEFGHIETMKTIFLTFGRYSQMTIEFLADRKAVEWVGKSAVIAGLIAARDKLAPLRAELLRKEAIEGLNNRIEVLRGLPD